jgi:integrase/recombinase XerD
MLQKRKVNLTKRVTTLAGKRYCPVAFTENRKIRQNWVTVNGKDEEHKEGNYYLEWTLNGTRNRLSVGKNAIKAELAMIKKQAALNAEDRGHTLVPEVTDESGHRLSHAIKEYLEETRSVSKPRTYSAYRRALGYFQESCPKDYVDKFKVDLRDKKHLAPRTVRSSFKYILTFLYSQGRVRDSLVNKGDTPRAVPKEVIVYEEADLEKLFTACSQYELTLFQFFLGTGMRDQEVRNCTWRDISFEHETVTVREKADWTPKGYKEREIPILASELVKNLKLLKTTADPSHKRVFPTSSGGLQTRYLLILKAVAKRAGLNPDDFILHRFRATFATWALRDGWDISVVQAWLGHVDDVSTMRYMKANRGKAIREKMDQGAAAKLFQKIRS